MVGCSPIDYENVNGPTMGVLDYWINNFVLKNEKIICTYI